MIAGRRLHAPQQDRAIFADPPLADLPDLLESQIWQTAHCTRLSILGRPLSDLRRMGMATAVEAAHRYLSAAGQDVPAPAPMRVLCAGHQPEMFHPGVWVKNFALFGLASATGMTPLNLVVDNDAAKATMLYLPAWPADCQGDPAQVTLHKVPFDISPGEAPYEEHLVMDEAAFEALPNQVGALTGNWPFRPLLPSYWSAVLEHRRRTPRLAERLVSGRRTLERQWGCQNLEVPVSRLCETEVFAWFAGHLLQELPRFHAIHNKTVRDYRKKHGLRSRNHPVPDLARDGDWYEAPLWAWRTGAARRGRLFARIAATGLDLRVDGEAWPGLPEAGTRFTEAWQGIHRDGWKIRSRALITTLFTRQFVADTFIHGIGGGKYDELTDELIRQFYGIEPPPFIVLSATLRLPFAGYSATQPERKKLAALVRDLVWNPQRHLDETISPEAKTLADRKRAMLKELANGRAIGRQRHMEFRRLTASLQPFVQKASDQLGQELKRVDAELQANAVLRRRDFAFCLFPEALLRPFCQQFLKEVHG
jgi:hypothetical protein